jgi:hypothetical protein
MNVEMVYGLSAVSLAVDNKAGALFAAAQISGKFLGLEEEPSGKALVSGVKFHNIPDMPFGNKEKMKRRLGIHIVKSQHLAVLIDFISGDFSGNNFTEYAVAHGFTLSQKIIKSYWYYAEPAYSIPNWGQNTPLDLLFSGI